MSAAATGSHRECVNGTFNPDLIQLDPAACLCGLNHELRRKLTVLFFFLFFFFLSG